MSTPVSWALFTDPHHGYVLRGFDAHGQEAGAVQGRDREALVGTLPAAARPVGRHPTLDQRDLLDAWALDPNGFLPDDVENTCPLRQTVSTARLCP